MKKLLIRFLPGPVKNYISRTLFSFKLKKATPVIVLQMGKVGSLSVYNSLLKQYPGIVIHDHSFGKEINAPRINSRKISYLYQRAVTEERPLKIISMTREPIARNISAFFEMFVQHTGVAYNDSSFTIAELKERFLSNLCQELPLTWFDDEIKKNFGIDVFSEPFPENGIQYFSSNNTELLVFKSEMEDKRKIEAIEQFLGIENFTMTRTNIGEDKEYARTYRDFKDQVRFSPEYIDMMCGSEYFNHFYGKETKKRVRDKWLDTG